MAFSGYVHELNVKKNNKVFLAIKISGSYGIFKYKMECYVIEMTVIAFSLSLPIVVIPLRSFK